VWKEVGAASVALLGLYVLVNQDVILARHFLPPRASGLYAAGSIISRVAFWAPQFVGVIAFPSLALGGGPRSLLRRAIALQCAVSGAVTTVVALTSGLLSGSLFGARYSRLGPDLWVFALIGTAFAVVQLLVLSGIAERRRHVGSVLLGTALLETAVIALSLHQSLVQIAVTAVASGVLATTVLGILRSAPNDQASARPASRPAERV